MIAPFAQWRPISTNYRPGAMHRPMMGLVLHHAVSGLEAVFNRFNTPGSGASSHFFVEYDGTVTQFVDTDDVAYAQCAGNWAGWISVENESPSDGDDLFPPLTAQQVAGCHTIFAWLVETEGIPNQVTDDPNVGGLAYHSMNPGPCDTHWGQTACPGDAIIAQRGEIVNPPLGDDMIYKAQGNSTTNPDVSEGTEWIIVGQSGDGTVLIRGEGVAGTRVSIDAEQLGKISVFKPGAGSGGGGLSLTEVTAIVRGELDKTVIAGHLGQ